MPNPLIAKLEHGTDLTFKDRSLLIDITRHARRLEARQDLIREGERAEVVHLVLEGVACRYKMLPGGGRQIVALLVPGDLSDPHAAILDAMDHSIATLSACTLVDIPRSTILDLTDHHPNIARAFGWSALVDKATSREWLVNLGKRAADQRMAHFFCELFVRLQTVGFVDADSYDLPLTQVELGDMLGLSAVQTNRTLQHLHDADLITLKDGRVTIPDVARLETFCGFRPTYLHLAMP